MSSGSMSGMSSPGMSQNQGGFGGLNDAFSGLSFAASPPATNATNSDSTTSARSDFTDYMKKSPAERIREQLA